VNTQSQNNCPSNQWQLDPTGEATAELHYAANQPPIQVVGNEFIRNSFQPMCLQQAINARQAPGVTDVVLNPDAHRGFGAPIGSVMVSPTHIYPGPVGVDVKCSMSLIQFDLPNESIDQQHVRRQLISAVSRRVPTGLAQKRGKQKPQRRIDKSLANRILVEGASPQVLRALGIPEHWRLRCEDAAHVGHDESSTALTRRLEVLRDERRLTGLNEKMTQLGSLGGGNHFGECEAVEVVDESRAREIAETFLLKDGCVAFLSHCGSRGLGHQLATRQFKTLQDKFDAWHIPFPGNDRELVYAPLGSGEANNYLDDIALASNFATINHLLINALVLEAFQEVFPGIEGELVYFISHNIVRKEKLAGELTWVHRKGATRAFPAGHPDLESTPFESTGHPILLPGDPVSGSAVMAAEAGAKNHCFSVNHGAGRLLGRKQAIQTLHQYDVDQLFAENDILSNCEEYPRDEAPGAYKDFNEVIASVCQAELASEVARLKARFVIKDG